MLDLTQEQKIKLGHAFLMRDVKNREAVSAGDKPYISADGLNILLLDLSERKINNADYNVNNAYVTWDYKNAGAQRPYQFHVLEKFFNELAPLEDGEDLKIIAGMEFPVLGHCVSVYCRRNKEILEVFVYDVTRGLTFKDSSSHDIIIAIRQFAQAQKLNYKIIINSTTLEKDHHTCSVFSFLSTRYFMKHGKNLFPLINLPKMHFPYNGLFEEGPDQNVVFLKAEHLPEKLLKWGQYESLEEYIKYHEVKVKRMREVYNIKANPICIEASLQYDDPDIFATKDDNIRNKTIVSSKKHVSLAQYRTLHRGNVYTVTGELKKKEALIATIEKERNLVLRIVDILNELDCITDDCQINERNLKDMLESLKSRFKKRERKNEKEASYSRLFDKQSSTPNVLKNNAPLEQSNLSP